MNIMKPVLMLLIIFFGVQVKAQENNSKDQAEAEMYLQEAGDALSENDFAAAEAAYRKAIAKDPGNPTAKYNLGNLYYNKEKPAEAGERLYQAGEIADSKETKHKAFHNLGNSFMRQERYKAAVEAYKEALRNNPSDEETRYNLALAKKMLEEEQQQQDDGEGGDNQDQEQEENQEQQEDQENQGGDGENEQESKDQGEQEEKKDEGEQQEDENQGEGDQEEEQEEGDQQEQAQPQPQQGQLSPDQIKSLLEAMNNEERKVQDKINAEKAKGAKVKTDKDW